jgi:ABC-2 type transport system permease protein
MVKKIYFPREVLPISQVTTNFVNMLLCFVVVFAVAFVSGRIPMQGEHFIAILCLIPVFAVEYILSLGMAFFAAAVTVYFRDMEHILGIVMMAWQYLTPVLYNLDGFKDNQLIIRVFNLNPMTPVITAYRDILYWQRIPDLSTLIWALILGALALVVGWFTFSKLKRRFAEEL